MCSKKSSCSSLHGFTLTELVVVILTMTIFLSLLMPALGKVKKQGRLVSCIKNQQKILAGLHVYAEGNEGKLPPHISMNDNGSAVWWDYPNYMACHRPYPVGGSLGWQFADIIPNVNVWLCPLSPMSPGTKSEGLDGVLRNYQKLYKNPDPVNHPWLWITLVPLWRYGGFADKNLTNNQPYSFLGPGTEPFEGMNENARESDLAIMDFIAFNYQSNYWISSHPFENSRRGGFFHQGQEGQEYPGEDITEEIGIISYNAGYIDGHVETFNTLEVDGQLAGRGMRFFLPDNW